MLQIKTHLFSRHVLAFLTLTSFTLAGTSKFFKNEMDFTFWQRNFVLTALISIIIFSYFWFSQKDGLQEVFDKHLDKLKNSEVEPKFIGIGIVYFLTVFYLARPIPMLLNLPFLNAQFAWWVTLPKFIRNLFGNDLIQLQKFLYFSFSTLVFLGFYFLAKKLWFKKEQKFLGAQSGWLQKMLGLGSLLALLLLIKIPQAVDYLGNFYENRIWSQRAAINFRLSTQILHRQLLNPYKFDPLFKWLTLILFGLLAFFLAVVLVIVFRNKTLHVDLTDGNFSLLVLGKKLFKVDKLFLYSLLLVLAVFGPYYFLNTEALKKLEFTKTDQITLSKWSQKLTGERILVLPEARFTKNLAELNLEIALFKSSYLRSAHLILPSDEMAKQLAFLLTSRLSRSFLQELANQKIEYVLVFKDDKLNRSQALPALESLSDILVSRLNESHLQIFQLSLAKKLPTCALNEHGLLNLIRQTVLDGLGKEGDIISIKDRQQLLLLETGAVDDRLGLRFYDKDKNEAGEGEVLLEPVFGLEGVELGYFEFPVGVDSFRAYIKNNQEIQVGVITSEKAENVLLRDCSH